MWVFTLHALSGEGGVLHTNSQVMDDLATQSTSCAGLRWAWHGPL